MKFKDIKDYLFGYEPLKQDIRTINSQLHNIDKNKVKQIYQKLSEINDNYLASLCDSGLVEFIKRTQNICPEDSDRISIRAFSNLKNNVIDYIRVYKDLFPLAYMAALKSGQEHLFPQITEDKQKILNGIPLEYKYNQFVTLIEFFVKVDNDFAEKLKNRVYTSEEIFNFYYKENYSVIEYCKMPDVFDIDSTNKLFQLFTYDDVEPEREILQRLIKNNSQMKLDFSKLDAESFKISREESLWKKIIDDNLFSRLILNNEQKEEAISYLSNHCLSHPNYKETMTILSKPKTNKNVTRKTV
jgi:hypothetical protein